MVHTYRKMLVSAGLVFCLFSPVFAYSGGSGTEADPYQIGTVSDWNDLMNTPSDWDSNFIMTADINLQGVALTPIGGLSLAGHPSSMPYFKGIFDGNGHVIRNAAINMPGYWHIALFGVIDTNSQIRNLGVEDVNMIGERDIAGLVGGSLGTITNCFAKGKIGHAIRVANGGILGGLVGLNYGTIAGSHAFCDVNGITFDIGGLVGRNFGTIIDSYADGTVNGPANPDNVGGLVGRNTWLENACGGIDANYIGTIARCFSAASVNGSYGVGGLVGTNGEFPFLVCSITDSYATGAVIGDGDVGGLIGSNDFGRVTKCYATGAVTGDRRSGSVGGLMGYNLGPVIDCYATGSVTGFRYIGGLIGSNSFVRIANCYAAGIVSGDVNVGGLIGYSYNIPVDTNCFWDVETSRQASSVGGTGLTTAEMMTLSTFTSAGWDFVNETANGPNDIWFIREGREYPRFIWENNNPIADAGSNQVVYAWIDGIAEVTLDGSTSYDADGDELTYSWTWTIDGNDYEANSVNPTIELPVGRHIISLIVNDGLIDSEPNEVVITVVEPIEGSLWVVPRIINGRCGQQRIIAMLRLPEGISRQQINARRKLLLYPGEIESNYQVILRHFEHGGTERVVIFAFFDKESLVDAVGKAGPVQLDVVGQLKTGRCFYGSDTVRIINPQRRPPRR